MIREQIKSRIDEIMTLPDHERLQHLVAFVEQTHNNAYYACKAIFAAEIRNEIFKTRTTDKDKNQEIINIIGGCYTCIEIEIQKKLTRSQQGEHIQSIYPSTKEKIND